MYKRQIERPRTLQNYTEYEDVEKILADIKSFMQRVTEKKQRFTSRELSSIPFTLGYALPQCRLDRFPKVRSFIAEREFLEGKAREGIW